MGGVGTASPDRASLGTGVTDLPMSTLAEALFSVGPEVRYVATYRHGDLQLRERAGLSDASKSESDKYEELLVDPTLLTLVAQRGDIDSGGLSYVLIRYGNFFQLVSVVPGGHVSVALERSADMGLVERLSRNTYMTESLPFGPVFA